MLTPCSNFPSATLFPLSWGHAGDGSLCWCRCAESNQCEHLATFDLCRYLSTLCFSQRFHGPTRAISNACITMLQLKRAIGRHVAASTAMQHAPVPSRDRWSYRSIHSTDLSQVYILNFQFQCPFFYSHCMVRLSFPLTRPLNIYVKCNFTWIFK